MPKGLDIVMHGDPGITGRLVAEFIVQRYPNGCIPEGQGSGFSNAPFPFPMAPRTRQNTTPGALEPVFEGGCGLSGVDSAADSRPARRALAGYPWSPGRFHRPRKPLDAANSGGPGYRVA